jgi:YHS domain-containing protein
MRAFLVSGLGLSLAVFASLAFSDDKAATDSANKDSANKASADKEVKLLCPISGEEIDKTVSADFNGGKVCFCCADCKTKFEQDSSKYATKANLQLAASGQAKQAACPFSGGAIKASTAVKVAGVEVQFCCDNCKAKVTSAKPDEQIKLVFDSKPFAKGFKVGKEKEKEKDK